MGVSVAMVRHHQLQVVSQAVAETEVKVMRRVVLEGTVASELLNTIELGHQRVLLVQ
jgi:hypothetical protein